MLPFTKRPGRGEESGDVVTKDDLAKPNPSPRSAPPRSFQRSLVSDEEMTTVLPSKSFGAAAPASAVSAPVRSRPTPSSSSAPRSMGRAKPVVEEEDEDGRTVVRGAPKIVRRKGPTNISPAAVIKATLESARGKNDVLMPAPPADLLDEEHPADRPERTVLLETGTNPSVNASAPPSMMGPPPPPSSFFPQMAPSVRPLSQPPMASSQPMMASPQTRPLASPPGAGMNPYSQPVPSHSVSVPGAMPASMPAHFMVPQAPYSDPRLDPPGTSVTARTKVAGRPAISWAAALLAFGLFVGVGAVALMQGHADGAMEAGAAFVDPSRAAGKGAPAPTPVPVDPATPAALPGDPAAVAVAAPAATNPSGLPPVLPSGNAFAVAPSPSAPVAAAGTAPAPSNPGAHANTKPSTNDGATKKTTTSKPVTHYVPPSAPKAGPVATEDSEPKASKPAAGTVAGKKAGGKGDDEETKKALKALEDAQLERSF